MQPVINSEENSWRANTYRILARFLSAPADKTLLALLSGIEKETEFENRPLARAWNQLAFVAEDADSESVSDEFHALFIGVSRGELLPYGSYYQSGFLMEKPLALLREDLQILGFQRRQETHEPEDHVSALCEVMSLLINEGDPRQTDFFESHIASWISQFFNDLEQAESADFYKSVARMGTAFFIFEKTFLLTTAHV